MDLKRGEALPLLLSLFSPDLFLPRLPLQFPMTEGAGFSFLDQDFFHHLDELAIL